MTMNWDETFEHFKKHTPDDPDEVDFDDQFPTGGFVIFLPQVMLKHIIDENRVSLDGKTILNDINRAKWSEIGQRIDDNEQLTPPWGKLNEDGRIAICQGCHRFQKAYLNAEDPIPVVFNEQDFEELKLTYGLYGAKLKP
ncbi:MAG: hypothetical protein ACJAS1_006322 [Oleiphilaceae bacterium]|jgi:hypothetical protein